VSVPEFHVLPTRTAGAAENMAVDFLLLPRYPAPEAIRFRHYGWRRAAFTFGYSQKIAYVREQLPAGETVELCRRPTGGGVVDHRDDWTYALVTPRAHASYELRAIEAYRLVHTALAEALRAQGQPVELKPACDPCAEAGPTVCFARPEQYDVVRRDGGAKVAGAAMKRNKHGLLFQGSIARATVPGVDWARFAADFTRALGRALGAEPAETPWPEFQEEELAGLVEQYGASEWVEQR